MKTLLLTCFAMFVAAVVSAQPAGTWLFGSTGRGTAHWTDETAGVVYQGGADFGWAVLSASSLRDGFVQVRFKPVAGREDQAGGAVWRWRDEGNYYVARANALEDNVVAYKVVGGRRIPLAPVGTPEGTYGVKAQVDGGAWHTLRVEFHEGDATVVYDGGRVFTIHDDTFRQAGKIGVWAKSDSVTEFETPQFGAKP